MSRILIRRSLAAVGLAALTFGIVADVAVAAAQATGGRSHRAPFATRAESIKLARRLLAKAVLPPGTRRFYGRKLPAALTAPAYETSATPILDVHRVFSERWSMSRTAGFLDRHHPAGWTDEGTGSGSSGKVVIEEDVTYRPRPLPAGFSDIEMQVAVVPRPHGHALTRVDIQVVWYLRKPASDYLVARHFKAVRIDEWSYGPGGRHVRRTFRQRAIIDKLTRVLNAEPVAPGGTWNCPSFNGPAVRLVFKPVRGRAGAVVIAYDCPPGYTVSIGGHGQPILNDNGKIEKIADKLLRGPHQPNR